MYCGSPEISTFIRFMSTEIHGGTARPLLSFSSASPAKRGLVRRPSRTDIVSPFLRRNEGVVILFPLIVKWPCETACRAARLVAEKPARYTTESALVSRSL